MFLIGIMGIGSKTESAEEKASLICPVCGKESNFHLCHAYDYFHFFFIPLIKYQHRYIATCGSCASAFEVMPESGKVIQNRQKNLTLSDLTLLRRGQPGRCPNCGRQNPVGSSFCNGCGSRIDP